MPLSTVNNGDTGLQARTAINAAISLLNIIKENVYKVTYYEIIAGANGSVTLPGQATINAGEFGLSGNAVLSEIDGSNKPTYVSPKTSGGVIVTASLNVLTGAWVKSGVTASANVAIIYSVNITEENYVNLDNNFIIETVESGKEDAITAGTTSQYWRGDKTFQTLDKTAVGLSNVDNTTDAGKPVSTAQQTALNLKENSSNKDASGGYAGLTLFKINFRNVANTFTSFFTNTNTAARTYTYQDRNGTIADDTDLASKASLTGTETLTNKTIKPRVLVVAQSATPATNIDNGDIVEITALAQAITSMSSGLTGTPYDKQMIMWQITGTATRAITWGASFSDTTNVLLPLTTVGTAMLRVLTQYNSATSKHECIAFD